MNGGVIDLTTKLLRIDTAGDHEQDAIDLVAPLLAEAGFDLTHVPWMPGRGSLVARWNGGGEFVLSGHVDTVPYGQATWAHGPLAAERDGDRLFGRGSSDMKGGVAAMVLASISAARSGARGFTVALTAGEETGCGGARTILSKKAMEAPGILIVGESTANAVRLGHKGATWLELETAGRAAHGSRPDLGVNAIEMLSDAVVGLRELGAGALHPYLGARTTNVGTISGGTQTNLVPDRAQMTVDIRPVPGASHESVREKLANFGSVHTILELPPVWAPTGAESTVTQEILDAVARVTGRQDEPAGVSYFTDAAVLDPTLARSYIIGPGDPDQPHSTDESVSIELVEQSVSVYQSLLEAWNRGQLG
ncbi:M20 family metallopeptidase [Salinibacterium sp. NK8237]|uniref:M20 family metallopeptidase n=1 Tax=Salinibacterium sp. NK8237 TaxID=2792038 RepID=UPI0018CF85CB|nr:M20 family metallopeptidase [Salinibacterium sp. NK8237]MBH0130698.1 M20 family metallopeptidase [Salinibacterium sp. NK8237]